MKFTKLNICEISCDAKVKILKKKFFARHWAENFPQTIMRKYVLKAVLLNLESTILSCTSFIMVMNGLG